ncbi:MAG: hypothetical protein AB2531_07340, partial [Candidatus Thiodiazotropha sp.]
MKALRLLPGNNKIELQKGVSVGVLSNFRTFDQYNRLQYLVNAIGNKFVYVFPLTSFCAAEY